MTETEEKEKCAQEIKEAIVLLNSKIKDAQKAGLEVCVNAMLFGHSEVKCTIFERIRY